MLSAQLEMFEASPQVEALRTRLAKLGNDYICSNRLPGTTATVSFLGQFQGQTVVWEMRLATLAHCQLAEDDAVSTSVQQRYTCPFIEVKEGVEGVYQLRVGLALAVIDEPAIKKTIIMIRNYKRLAIGKIELSNHRVQ